MSKRIIAMCDCQGCETEIEICEGETAREYEGWGTVYGCDEDYCPECWEDYCFQENVDVKTGKDLSTSGLPEHLKKQAD